MDQYLKAPERQKKQLIEFPKGEWRLSSAERKRILTNSIYGVDIDLQAVEVTKLSLLLKVLEGESAQSLQIAFELMPERALPDLGDNVKCGNSLVSPSDTLSVDLLAGVEDGASARLFDWGAEYSRVMGTGREGFDAVIGNPPYGAQFDEVTVQALHSKYLLGGKNPESYALFIEQGLRLLRPHGMLGFIVPTGWYSGEAFARFRRAVVQSAEPRSFVNLPYDVFDAWIDTTVFVAAKRAKPIAWPPVGPLPVNIRTFAKKHRITLATEFYDGRLQADASEWFRSGSDEFLTYLDG